MGNCLLDSQILWLRTNLKSFIFLLIWFCCFLWILKKCFVGYASCRFNFLSLKSMFVCSVLLSLLLCFFMFLGVFMFSLCDFQWEFNLCLSCYLYFLGVLLLRFFNIVFMVLVVTIKCGEKDSKLLFLLNLISFFVKLLFCYSYCRITSKLWIIVICCFIM